LVFSANYIQDVVDTVFCIGQFQYVKREIKGKEVYAVYCGTGNIGSELDRKADMIAKLFDDYMSRFGDFPFKKYIAIYAEHTPDNKFIHGTAHGSGFAGPIEMPLAYTIQFTAHEIFHIWNGRILSQKSPYEVWFKEGFTQYYGYITPYRAGLYGKEQFIYYLKDDYQNYIQNYKASEDIALARVNEGTARQEGYNQAESISNFIMYRKGALVASLVDDEIRKATNGEKNIDDLIRQMLVEYRDKAYSSDDVLKSLNMLTGKDFTKFFSDYIYGRAKLPLAKELSQND
jgi:predicted metalloprotease with PDZ domain